MCGRFVTRFLGDRGGQVLKGDLEAAAGRSHRSVGD